MDILITVALFVIALCMVFGKGFTINIKHIYDMPHEVNQVNPVNPVNQEKLDDDFKVMTDVVQTIQDFMGVNRDE